MIPAAPAIAIAVCLLVALVVAIRHIDSRDRADDKRIATLARLVADQKDEIAYLHGEHAKAECALGGWSHHSRGTLEEDIDRLMRRFVELGGSKNG